MAERKADKPAPFKLQGEGATDEYGTYGGGRLDLPEVTLSDYAKLKNLNVSGGFFAPKEGDVGYSAALLGRLQGAIPVGKNTTLSPYADAELRKTKGSNPHWRGTEFGVELEHKFAKGGTVRGAGCAQRGVKKCKMR